MEMQTTQATQILSLPTDLIGLVCSELPLDMLPTAPLICKRFNDAIDDNVWKASYMKSFGGELSQKCKSWRRYSRETLAIFLRYLGQGNRFCVYYGEQPDLEKLPNYPNIAALPISSIIEGHTALVKIMLKAAGNDAPNLVNKKVPRRHKLGSDEWFPDSSVFCESNPIKLCQLHIDVDHIIGDGYVPLLTRKKIPPGVLVLLKNINNTSHPPSSQ